MVFPTAEDSQSATLLLQIVEKPESASVHIQQLSDPADSEGFT